MVERLKSEKESGMCEILYVNAMPTFKENEIECGEPSCIYDPEAEREMLRFGTYKCPHGGYKPKQ